MNLPIQIPATSKSHSNEAHTALLTYAGLWRSTQDYYN